MTTALPTTVNTNVPKLVALDPAKITTTLADVIARAEEIESSENADVIVDLADLKMNNDGNLVVP